MVINKREGKLENKVKRCDLQSQGPFERCRDEECNIGHSVQTDQNDENLSSSQFMSKIEQSVFPTTLLQLKTLSEIWFLLIDFFKFLRPVQLFPGLDVVDQCIILCTKSSKLDKFQFSNYSESVTRLIMILHDSVVRGHVSLTPPPSPSENPTSLSENQSGEIDQSQPTTRFPFLNHFIRPGLHSGSCRQNKISRQFTWYNHNCFFQENHEKTKI